MKKRYRSLVGSALIAATISVGAQAQESGGELVFALPNDLTSANPIVSTGWAEVLVGCSIYQGLVAVSRDLEISPLLAESWEISEDGKTYTFKLHDNVKWSDGEPFTSADVAYSLLQANSEISSVFRGAAKVLDTIETPAPNEVIIHLKESFGPFLMALSCTGGGAILPKHVFEGTDIRTNPASGEAPVGTGPFTVAEWQRGSRIVLAKNESYWEEGKPYLDKVTGTLIPQETSRVQALQTGEIDFALGRTLLPSSYDAIKANPDLKMEISGYAAGVTYIEFNTRFEPLSKPEVRKALAMATDRPYLLRSVWFGDGELSLAPFSITIPWVREPSIDFSKDLPLDVDAANAMLDEAGFPRGADGKRFAVRVVHASNAPDRAQLALNLKAMWAQVGVDVTPLSLEASTYLETVYKNMDYEISLVSLNTFGDPALGITRVYASSGIGQNYANASGWSDPKVDELFGQAQAATSYEDRAAFYGEAQKIIAEALPVLPVREARPLDGATKRLHGLWGSLGPGDLGNTWLSAD